MSPIASPGPISVAKPTKVVFSRMQREFYFNCPYCQKYHAIMPDCVGRDFVCFRDNCRQTLRLMLFPKEWELVRGALLHWKCVWCNSPQVTRADNEYVNIPCKACGLVHTMPYSFDKFKQQLVAETEQALIEATSASVRASTPPNSTYRCSHCAMMIPTAARVCPYCRSTL
jgi:DNA-directed RNA polymerase subunit RPC12/RpoP